MLNFFVVPAMLYQQQQKVKLKKSRKSGRPRSSKSSSSEKAEKGDTRSLRSSATVSESHTSFAETPETESINTAEVESRNSGHNIVVSDSVLPSKDSPLKSISVDKGELVREITHKDASSVTSMPLSLSAHLNNFKMGDPPSNPSIHKGSTQYGHGKRNSVSSGSTTHTNRRNSSMSASSHVSLKAGKGRKTSYSQVPSASGIEYPPDTLDMQASLYTTRSCDVKKFVPITDLSILNSDESIGDHFYNPAFMRQRYNNYLNMLSDHYLSDPINFATVREHSLLKFLSRHKVSRMERMNGVETKGHDDVRYYEGLISYVLLQCRTLIRELIRLQSAEDESRGTIITSEELMQSNFINYVRYLVELPANLSVFPENLDEAALKHYEFKAFFNEISGALYALKKEGLSDDISSFPADTDLLLQSITKVSYEYILLEKYLIQILVKFNHDFLIESRITKHLFGLYDLNMKLESTESIKVLNFNAYFSSQYSWYLAITIPFVRVIETNVYNEHRSLVEDYDAYQGQLNSASSKKVDFSRLDKNLYSKYFKVLNLKNYELYVNMSRKELAELQRRIISEHEKCSEPDEGADDLFSQIKPPNFEYYTNSLSTMTSETFHVIQSRDLNFQLNPSNFRVILGEFYRLLKKGGVLELPIFRSGDEYLQTLPEATKYAFPDLQTLMSFDIAAKLDLIPHFIETLFNELANLFGPKNVKFSSVLLTPKNEMNRYLIKHTAMSLYEIFGCIDQFCELYGTDFAEDKGSDSFHYYFYIRAEKL